MSHDVEEIKTADTNITEDIKEVFEALTSGNYNSFALFSCFVNGEPAAAIVNIRNRGEAGYTIHPVFVSITPGMVLTDHDGVETKEDQNGD